MPGVSLTCMDSLGSSAWLECISAAAAPRTGRCRHMSPSGQGEGAHLSTHLVHTQLTCQAKGTRWHTGALEHGPGHFANAHGQTTAGFKLGPTHDCIDTRSQRPREFWAKTEHGQETERE